MPASKRQSCAGSAAFKGAFLRNAGKYQGKPCCVSADVGQASVLSQIWPLGGGAGQSLIRWVTLLWVCSQGPFPSTVSQSHLNAKQGSPCLQAGAEKWSCGFCAPCPPRCDTGTAGSLCCAPDVLWQRAEHTDHLPCPSHLHQPQSRPAKSFFFWSVKFIHFRDKTKGSIPFLWLSEI